MPRQTVIVFFKFPEPGKVKTRLASEIGDDKACEVYCLLLKHTRDICSQWEDKASHREVVYYGTGDAESSKNVNFKKSKRQNGKDLGLRMENAIREELVFTDSVCIIGTDLPDLSVALLESAFESLNHQTCVLGPAIDGGFYLFSTNVMPVHVFANLRWSNENTLTDTCRRLRGRHLQVHFLEEKRDIDSLNDLKEYPRFYT